MEVEHSYQVLVPVEQVEVVVVEGRIRHSKRAETGQNHPLFSSQIEENFLPTEVVVVVVEVVD